MKKVLFIAAFAVLSLANVNAQETKFAGTAGFVSASLKTDVNIAGVSVSATTSESGFYVGVVGDFGVSETFDVRAELLYASITDFSQIMVPIMAKFGVSDEFSLLAGPQITYSLEDLGDDFSKLGIGLGAGASYDFSETLFAQARYTFQLNDSYTGDIDGISYKANYLTVGVGYRF